MPKRDYPDLCARYIETWREDLTSWKGRWANIQTMPSVEAALAELTLEATPTNSIRRILHPRDRSTSSGLVSARRFDMLRDMAGHLSTWRPGASFSDTEQDTEPKMRERNTSRRGLLGPIWLLL